MKGYVIFDLEATCYDRGTAPKGFSNEIIEIGAVRLDAEGNETGVFSEFAQPLIHPVISEFCNTLTTITQEDIDGARPLKEVLSDFLEWSDGHVLVSWGQYDKNQIISDMRRNQITDDRGLLVEHRSIKHLHQRWNRLQKPLGLGGALHHEGLRFDGVQHRGIDDARNITKIFLKYFEQIKSNKIEW
jgi:3'-5' exoribonuclease 1